MSTRITTDNPAFQTKYDGALEGIRNNIHPEVRLHDRNLDLRVLYDGDSCYLGAWLEVCPLTSLLYGQYQDPEIALAGHQVFMDTQNAEGLLPFAIFGIRPCYGHVQELLPLSRTALAAYTLTGNQEFLEKAYRSGCAQDAWLDTYRDSRKLGLVECFCEFDTGHDNSNRFFRMNQGMPRTCPPRDEKSLPEEARAGLKDDLVTQIIHGDARNLVRTGTLPWLSPDLSATKYGNRKALARMAQLLGLDKEAHAWSEKAEKTRIAILTYLYDPETECFYDLDINNRFIRVVSDAVLKVLCEQVVDRSMADAIFKRHVLSPAGFWSPVPMASIAVSDPMFSLTNHPHNNWSGHVQPLAGLRTSLYFGHYGHWSGHRHLMEQQLAAIMKSDGYRQQLDPFTGQASGEDAHYTPAMVAVIDYTARLYGVREEEGQIEWNCRMPSGCGNFTCNLSSGAASFELRHTRDGSVLAFGGVDRYQVKGACRILTDREGSIKTIIGTAAEALRYSVTRTDGQIVNSGILAPDQEIAL